LRTLDDTTDRPVIIAGGLTQYGTIGAGEFLSNPEYFSEAVRQFPKNWPKRNLQNVLQVPVVNRFAGRPRFSPPTCSDRKGAGGVTIFTADPQRTDDCD